MNSYNKEFTFNNRRNNFEIANRSGFMFQIEFHLNEKIILVKTDSLLLHLNT